MDPGWASLGSATGLTTGLATVNSDEPLVGDGLGSTDGWGVGSRGR